MIHGAQASDSYYSSSGGSGDTGSYSQPSIPVSAPAPASAPTPVVSAVAEVVGGGVGYSSSGAAYTPMLVTNIPTGPTYQTIYPTSPAPSSYSAPPAGYQGGTYNPATGETTGGSPSEAQMAADRAAAGITPSGPNYAQALAMNIPVNANAPYVPVGVPYTPIMPQDLSLQRPDYRNPLSLGDSYTQQLVNKGSTLEQALYAQQQAAQSPREKAYYEMELRSALVSNLALASEYHYQAKASGLPTALNPFEYTSDLSLSALGKGSFKQYGSFDLAAIDAVARAKATGDVGPYNTNNLYSYSSTYGKLSVLEQQDIAKKVASTRPDFAIDESRLTKLPSAKDFGYGGKVFMPSSEVQGFANQLEYAEQLAKNPKSQNVLVTDKFMSSAPDVVKNSPELTFSIAGDAAKYAVEGGVFKGSPALVAMEKSLGTQSSAIDVMLKGRLNEKNEFTGTAAEFAALTKMSSEYEINRKSYNDLYGKEYATSQIETNLVLTPMSRESIFGKPEAKKSLWEEVVASSDRLYDQAGGFIRSVGSMTKTAWTPNIVDLAVDIPFMKYVNPAVTLAARPGAQEKESGTTFASKGEVMPYGAYSELSADISSQYIQPVVGSPAKYEGYTKMWEAEYNKPNATSDQKIIAGLNMIGSSANAYFIKNPGEVPTIMAQAAVIEVTGIFGALGKGSEYVLGKGASLIGKAESPLVQKGISAVGKYGIDAAFGTMIVGSATSNEKGEWFRTTEPTAVYKNIGPLGVQLTAFTAGTYAAGYARDRATDTRNPMERAMDERGYVEDAKFTMKNEPVPPSGPAGSTRAAPSPAPASGGSYSYSYTKPSSSSSGGGTSGGSAPARPGDLVSPARIFKDTIEGRMAGDKFAQYEAAYKMRTYNDIYIKTGNVKFKDYADLYPSLRPAGEIINPYTGKIEYRAGKSGKIEYGDFGMTKTYSSPTAQKADMIPRAAFEGVQSVSGTGGFKLRPEGETYTFDKVTGKYNVEKFTPDKPYSASSKEVTVYKDPFKEVSVKRPKEDMFKEKTKEIDIWKDERKVDTYRRPKEESIDFWRTKEKSVDIFKRPKEELDIFRKPKNEVDIFKAPKEIDLFKVPKRDIVPVKRTDIDIWKAPKEKIVPPPKKTEIDIWKAPKDEITTTKKGEIDLFKPPRTDLDIWKRPKDEIKPFKDELPKEKKLVDELPKTGGGVALPPLPWGGLGGGGSTSGGKGEGRGRGFSEFFRYGYGIKTDLFGLEKSMRPKKVRRL